MAPVSDAAGQADSAEGATVAVDEATETIAERAEAVRRAETDRALARLQARRDLTEAEVAAVRTLAARLTGQLVAAPVATLRSADAEVASVALDLFGED